MVDIADAYVEVQDRLIDVLLGLEDSGIETPVPDCPGWSVHDVVAHHTGVIVDTSAGHAPEFHEGLDLLEQWRDDEVARSRDAFTARQVHERRDRSMSDLVDEWRGATAALVPMMRGEQEFPAPFPPFTGIVVVNDLVVHEGDIRAALELEPPPGSAALSLALTGYAFSLENRIRLVGVPALVLAYEGKERRLGDGDPKAVVRSDRHELVRMLAGRRSREQILALDWEGDPQPYLELLSEYGPVSAASGY